MKTKRNETNQSLQKMLAELTTEIGSLIGQEEKRSDNLSGIPRLTKMQIVEKVESIVKGMDWQNFAVGKEKLLSLVDDQKQVVKRKYIQNKIAKARKTIEGLNK